MLLNRRPSSKCPRSASQDGASPAFRDVLIRSVLAMADCCRAAGGGKCITGKVEIDDLIKVELLCRFDLPDRDVVFHGPFGARAIKPDVHGPHAVPCQIVPGIIDGITGFSG